MDKQKKIEQEISEENKKIFSDNLMIELKLKEDNTLNREEAERIVKSNYLSNFLVDLKNVKEKILVMGINPGGGKEIKKELLPVSERLQCIDADMIEEDMMNKLTEVLNKDYLYQRYYYPNYRLFKDIKGRLFWSYYSEEKLKVNFSTTLKKAEDREVLEKIFSDVINKEKKKSGPCIIFGDLFLHADTKQENIKNAINIFLEKGQQKRVRKEEKKKENEEKFKQNKDELNGIIKSIMDKQIKFYNPMMIVVTNAYASDLIKDALKKDAMKYEEDMLFYNNTYIVFSGMVSGQMPMDKYSYFRLKSRINDIYENIKSR